MRPALLALLLLLPGCPAPEKNLYVLPDDLTPGAAIRTTEPGLFGTATITYAEAVQALPERRFAVREVRKGAGAEATAYRRYKVAIAMTPLGKGVPEEAEVTFVWPLPTHPDPAWRGHMYMTMGRVPDRFLAGIAGMRVGGVRAFDLPASTEDRHFFFDGPSRKQPFTRLPADVAWRCEARLMEVCKPFVVQRNDYLSAIGEVRKPLVVVACD